MSDPLIVTAVFPPEVQDELDDRRRRFFPPDRRVVGAHLTLFHALPGDAEQEAREVLDEVTGATAPEARVTGGKLVSPAREAGAHPGPAGHRPGSQALRGLP